MSKFFKNNSLQKKDLHKSFVVILAVGFFLSFASFFFSPSFVVYAQDSTHQSAGGTTDTLTKQVLADIEAKVQKEYNSVYAAELKKKTPDTKAKQIAQAAADKKRAELMTAAIAAAAVTAAKKDNTDDEGIPQEAAGYVARTYDGVDWSGSLTINNPTGKTDIAQLITKLINWLLLIIGMVATAVIIISGIMLVFNGGSESTIKKAKTTILWAVLGLVISIGAFALVNIIQSLL